MTSSDEILREVRALRADVARFIAIVAPLAVRQLSRAAQARKAGVHPSTLWRRERRAKAKLVLRGIS
jgi:hypothetical protein